MTERELLDLKEEITEAKNKAAEIRGQITALKKQLKHDFGCETIEEAKKKVLQMEKDITKLSNQIDKDVIKLEEQCQQE